MLGKFYSTLPQCFTKVLPNVKVMSFGCHHNVIRSSRFTTNGHFNVTMQSYWYMNSNYKYKTVSWPSSLHNGNPCSWKYLLYIEIRPETMLKCPIQLPGSPWLGAVSHLHRKGPTFWGITFVFYWGNTVGKHNSQMKYVCQLVKPYSELCPTGN